MILDYFLPLSTKLNEVEFDIYLNKTKAFGAIAPSSVAFYWQLEQFKITKGPKPSSLPLPIAYFKMVDNPTFATLTEQLFILKLF